MPVVTDESGCDGLPNAGGVIKGGTEQYPAALLQSLVNVHRVRSASARIQ